MENIDHDGKYSVLWPRSARTATRKSLAPKLDTLNGKVVLQLWDFVFRGDKVFALLEEGLRAKFPSVKFISWREIGNVLGNDEREVVASLPGRIQELKVDAVIAGMAC